MASKNQHVAIIGAGPIGLAAAAHLHRQGIPFSIFESGARPGSAISKWGHVRMFSPWRHNMDETCVEMLRQSRAWNAPDQEHIPTGDELVRDYLEPLASLPSIRPHLKLGATVLAVTRNEADRSWQNDRDKIPFQITFEETVLGRTEQRRMLATAVLDASGLMHSPRPVGSNGLPIDGEEPDNPRVLYHCPNRDEIHQMGRRILVIGSGHTAMQCLVALGHKQSTADYEREIHWAVRGDSPEPYLRVQGKDRFPGRLALHEKTRQLLDRENFDVLCSARFARMASMGTEVEMTWLGGESRVYDQVVVAAGYKPQYSMTSELQLEFHPVFECPAGMSAVVEAAQHACSEVPSHGEVELRHPEKDFYIVGMRSFGRASSFFLVAGYEQVRTIAARLAGNDEEAIPKPYDRFDEDTLKDFLDRHPNYLTSAFG